MGYEMLMQQGITLTDGLIRANPLYSAQHGTKQRDVLDAAERITVKQVFGALSKHSYPIQGLLAAARQASSFNISNQKGTVMILPHGIPDILKYTRQESMVYSVSGPALLEKTNGQKLDLQLQDSYTDVSTSIKILVHRQLPTFGAGTAHPDVGLSGLQDYATFGCFYPLDKKDSKNIIAITDLEHGTVREFDVREGQGVLLSAANARAGIFKYLKEDEDAIHKFFSSDAYLDIILESDNKEYYGGNGQGSNSLPANRGLLIDLNVDGKSPQIELAAQSILMAHKLKEFSATHSNGGGNVLATAHYYKRTGGNDDDDTDPAVYARLLYLMTGKNDVEGKTHANIKGYDKSAITAQRSTDAATNKDGLLKVIADAIVASTHADAGDRVNVLVRPRIKALMSSAIIAAPGEETGSLLVGYPFVSFFFLLVFLPLSLSLCVCACAARTYYWRAALCRLFACLRMHVADFSKYEFARNLQDPAPHIPGLRAPPARERVRARARLL